MSKYNQFIALLIISLFLFSTTVSGNTRIIQSVNTNWQFSLKDSASGWETVNIPHSFNRTDVLDDEPGYYRGTAWYKKKIYVSESWKGKDIYLHFEGVNQIAVVYVKGRIIKKHIGGYTAFNCKLSDVLKADDFGSLIEVVVEVDNSHNEDIPPLSADFTFFGGIYRDVFLQILEPVHFTVNQYAADDMYITYPKVNNELATVAVNGSITNHSSLLKSLHVEYKLFNAEGMLEKKTTENIRIAPGKSARLKPAAIMIDNPNLWSPEQPYLYRLEAKIVDSRTKQIQDELLIPVGFRWFSFQSGKGFYLNGKPYKIWGASRHQDYDRLGNAVPDELQRTDVKLIKEMGGNFLRVAHYPQDPAIMESCDKFGLLTSVEIPVVNAITETKAFTANCIDMLQEMIHQNFNHPSVVIWAYMNEILLRPKFTEDTARQQLYYHNIQSLAKTLDSLTRKEDPSRYTMMACHGNYKLYKTTGLLNIPMIIGWNLYQGWYGGSLNDFGKFLDKHHAEFPAHHVLITEYGADADPRVRSLASERFDKSHEYQVTYHQTYFKAISKRNYVSGGLVWNLADFSSEQRAETMPHINNKGLLDIKRQAKDAYYFYQSKLLMRPFIKISSHNWKYRAGIADSTNPLTSKQPVSVYTNIDAPVTIKLNGAIINRLQPVDNIITIDLPFKDSTNLVECFVNSNGKEYKDMMEMDFQLQPAKFTDNPGQFKDLNISLGDKRMYNDGISREVWLPEKPYTAGSWGYIGGEVFALQNKNRMQYGSDKNILGTDLDAIYATQRAGIQEFRMDVPDGKYLVVLHFAELLSDIKKEGIAYNLDTAAHNDSIKTIRSFDVSINGEKMIDHLSNTNYLQPERAYATKIQVIAQNNKGIVISFGKISGETILNGVQIKRVY